MNSVQTITIDNKVRPVALKRSSIKVIKNPSLDNSTSSSSSVKQEFDNHYTNTQTRRDSQQATRVSINAAPHARDSQNQHIKLIISNKTDITQPLQTETTGEQDTYLTTLIKEYQLALNRRDCDSSSCYRFKLLSYRISQTLLDRINVLKKDLKSTQETDISRMSLQKQSGFDSNHDIRNLSTSEKVSSNQDPDSLINLVSEKNKRIQDLEKLVEDQKRLRLQDASQVEEKAARIKEWVANKLKELENQNKQLRDYNRKQKEEVELLSCKLANLSPLSSPKQTNATTADSVQYIDQSSPVASIDIEKSLKTRKPQLKKTLQASCTSSDEDCRQRTDSGTYRLGKESSSNKANEVNEHMLSYDRNLNLKENLCNKYEGQDSPVYDSVSVEQLNRRANKNILSLQETSHKIPPPPPLHQSDKWELQLYSLADESLSSLLKQQDDKKSNESFMEPYSIESNPASEKDTTASRKSSSSFKNELISLVKPSFTTIDGDHVVDSLNSDSILPTPADKFFAGNESVSFSSSSNPQGCYQINRFRKNSTDSYEISEVKPSTPNLFDSPLRSRSGKDNILRTQSVRRNPAPEKLYDFITADLIKRGYLVKPGALKNHNRWILHKNFHLYSYKSESEETTNTTPNLILKLDRNCQVQAQGQTSDFHFPFKIIYGDKTLQLIAATAQTREEWMRILTVAINMSDIEPDSLKKDNSAFEGLMNVTRHGHSKRCYATIIGHVLFFLKSLTDPTPIGYLPVRGSRIREITDSYDYDFEEQELIKQRSDFQDCSLAIYPKYSMTTDPVYITLGGQQDTDKWFFFLSLASGVDQSYGTQFERTLTQLMINNSVVSKRYGSEASYDIEGSGCSWKEHSIMLYNNRPISKPLTTLPNETLRIEAVELFKSILLFTQVPLEPSAIDYHVCLLQNCLGRFLKYPELRNEFYAQLVKQSTFVIHRCNSPKLSSSSSGNSAIDQRSSMNSLSPSCSECQFVTDVQQLNLLTNNAITKIGSPRSPQLSNFTEKGNPVVEEAIPPTQSELLQVMQMLSVAVSLNLPRGRMRWWLMDLLRKFANPDTNIGKYALYTLKSIDRTVTNGTRDNIPSRMEIMSILLRNPYDHSNPHSLPVSFSDGSYLVVGADGSTTIEEFMCHMAKDKNIRDSLVSDFYLFADDPSGSRDLHILEPQRKVLDIVGWWEQTFRRHNSGRYQNTRAIKLICKKRLVLRSESEETNQERLLIVHQMNNEVVSHKIPLSDSLVWELGAIMAQLTFGDFENKSKDPNVFRCVVEKISNDFLPNYSSQNDQENISKAGGIDNQLVERWQHLKGKSSQDCVRVYLNCIRRLKFNEQ